MTLPRFNSTLDSPFHWHALGFMLAVALVLLLEVVL